MIGVFLIKSLFENNSAVLMDSSGNNNKYSRDGKLMAVSSSPIPKAIASV